MDVQNLFEQAVTDSKSLTKKPGNAVMLQLYALYKQATQGDVNVAMPNNMLDFVAKAKYNAWDELKGKPGKTAMQDYIDLVNSLKALPGT